MNPPPSTASSRRPRHVPPAAVALAVALLLGGCGVRLDSPPPTEPVPDPVEIVRRTAVDDALLVAGQAEAVAGRKDTKPVVAEALTQISEISLDHADQLGGVYESGLASDAPAPSPSASEGSAPGPDKVLATLRDAAARNATAADVCEDGPLARLLASVSAAQTLSARKLAETAGKKLPPYTPPVVPGSPQAAASPAPSDDGGDEGGSDDDDATTTAVSAASRLTTAPAGLEPEDLDAVILAEDSTAYAYEVAAAWSDEEPTQLRLLNLARRHRERGQGWARVAGVAGTEKDPRRAAYQLPDRGATAKDVVVQAESRLAAGYASLVAQAEPATRAAVVALLADSALTQRAWGAPLPPFPGLPEQARA
ncbi:DUF4439 domain-containing protein [Myceligenerans crystallogenes]|uniref:DUF4439 domain-containing protein n=1 Tax=Myceligenerans crystallogenes TaxID=316335 RepID=A0ABP4ZVU4_9MICO